LESSSKVDDIVNELFTANAMYLNPKIVKKRQLSRLVEKLVINLGRAADKENNDFRGNNV